MTFSLSTYLFIIFLPFFSFLIIAFLGKRIGKKIIGTFATACIIVSSVLSWLVYSKYLAPILDKEIILQIGQWINLDNLKIAWSICINPLSATMLVIITTISSLVHLYSVGYMVNDPGFSRFMAYLGFFTFTMLVLVVSDNLLQMFLGWEGVGLSSYLLIGFWYEKDSANNAAFKAFLTNRVGDIGLILGIIASYYVFDTLSISNILLKIPHMTSQFFTVFGVDFNSYEVICFLLLLGAIAKSAQIGLHIWLPDAMEGPTPVSALIHAATMVTAGVFLIAKLSSLYELAPYTRSIIIILGSITAFFAGTVAMVQNDIKKVIAYSTCSQLGFMFIALGLSAYNLAIFHLFTHAFFKALLFLGAGSVIHAMSNQQDMNKMGGIWKLIPTTFICMILGTFALTGIPYFAGYYSKDAILISLYNDNIYAYIFANISVLITALYSWRMIMLTFMGKVKADENTINRIHEPGYSMMIPLIILSIGAIFAGLFGQNWFLGSTFWQKSLVIKQNVSLSSIPPIIHHIPLIFTITGSVLGIYYSLQPKLHTIKQKLPGIYKILHNKWYFDKLYDVILIKPILKANKFLNNIVEKKYINGYGLNGIVKTTNYMSQYLSKMHKGIISNYIFGFIVALITMFILLI